MNESSFLKTTELSRYYKRGHQEVRALDRISITIESGEFLGVVGSSGSGKTTFLNLLAGLDTPTSGSIEIRGTSLSNMSRRQLASYRAHSVGIVFQSFNLISHYTALQNVETALYFIDASPKDRHRLASEILNKLGLGDRLTHRPADLSGGEQQRVALARAIVKKPEILFADEPTGNLDYENAQEIGKLLTSLNQDGLTIVMVTHNLDIAKKYTHRSIKFSYGKIKDENKTTDEGLTS
jgi:putative ABC transport system ATP-binding protein